VAGYILLSAAHSIRATMRQIQRSQRAAAKGRRARTRVSREESSALQREFQSLALGQTIMWLSKDI